MLPKALASDSYPCLQCHRHAIVKDLFLNPFLYSNPFTSVFVWNGCLCRPNRWSCCSIAFMPPKRKVMSELPSISVQMMTSSQKSRSYFCVLYKNLWGYILFPTQIRDLGQFNHLEGKCFTTVKLPLQLYSYKTRFLFLKYDGLSRYKILDIRTLMSASH